METDRNLESVAPGTAGCNGSVVRIGHRLLDPQVKHTKNPYDKRRKIKTGGIRNPDPMSPVSFSFHQVFMTPEAGYVAPSGCSCVAGEGISFGCANHKSLSPPLLGPQCYVHYWNDME